MKLAISGAIVLAAIGVTAYVTSAFMRSPDYYCTTKPITELWTSDRAYKATLFEKNCNSGESLFYSVRVDAFSPPLRRGWFNNTEIEYDARYDVADSPPALRWATPRQLEIKMKTYTLSGTLKSHNGDDLTMVRIFEPEAPDTFPVF
ncbi:MAG TPA: hypothetical protein VG328_26355 [Stellaceae bacterium]|jgi:hypothetical protein|nr:hypothetical protein [Stellaceae bacterium]